ncbi:uncharacterized protein LOC126997371 [Eriocheir sinensis]|uniref:uncharacterized protein LOC126997371 n=1 Tax=Eriocheir sinensis TaxID=95602 RepID=UPI0021C8E6F7|nr:uncharacterized protein LOC126997371 [Eriocheir sinensis]
MGSSVLEWAACSSTLSSFHRQFLPAQPARADVQSEMNTELLISEVFKRQPLWNKRNKFHTNKNVVDKLWAEVSKELDYEESLVKRKWKYIGDKFAVELEKFPSRSKEQYSQLFRFLIDIVKPRVLTGNFSSMLAKGKSETSLPGSSQVGNQTDDVEPPLDKEEGMPASPTLTQDTSVRGDEDLDKHKIILDFSHPKKKATGKSLKTEDYNQSILEIERQKMQYLREISNQNQGKDDDEDLMFLKSLLPHIKKILDANKLTFRSRIQELVQQFAYQVPITSPLPHTSSSSVSAHTSQVSPYSNEHTHSPLET